jgi:hypothetical protein
MPRYRARNVKIQLVASSLNDCTTINPTNTSTTALPDAIRCDEALRKATILPERLVADPDHETKSCLHLVDSGNDAVPLYLAHVRRQLPTDVIQESSPRFTSRHHNVSAPSRKDASSDMLGQSSPESQQRASQPPSFIPSKIDPDCQPYALGVLIELTKLTCQHPSLKQPIPPDIRYDVFLNGDLLFSDYIRNRYIAVGGEKSTTVLVAGRRLASYIECPVVVLPFGLDAKGEIITANRARHKVQDRWNLIGKSFAKHAQELRYWLKDNGRESPLATFFDALASFEIPPELKSLPPKGPQMFGIIDVVISSGRGTTKPNAKFMNSAKLMPRGHSSNEGIDGDMKGSDCSTTSQYKER